MITDFDPLQCLQDLQTGFLALEQNQQILLNNQHQLQAQLTQLLEVQQRLQSLQDCLYQLLSLTVEAQKTHLDSHANTLS